MTEEQSKVEEKFDNYIKTHRDAATVHARAYAKNDNPEHKECFKHHENIADILAVLKEEIIEIYENEEG